jgi:hypothetical protein
MISEFLSKNLPIISETMVWFVAPDSIDNLLRLHVSRGSILESASPILIAACRLFIVDQLFWEDYLASNYSSRCDKGKSVHAFQKRYN